jgi:insertion element IS1 protein InsB
VAFEVGDRSEITGDRLFRKIDHEKVKLYCTDNYEVYNILIPKEKHIATKKETYTVEGVNTIIRHFLARFTRRTLCYSKSVEMIRYSLNLLFYRRNFKCIPI